MRRLFVSPVELRQQKELMAIDQDGNEQQSKQQINKNQNQEIFIQNQIDVAFQKLQTKYPGISFESEQCFYEEKLKFLIVMQDQYKQVNLHLLIQRSVQRIFHQQSKLILLPNPYEQHEFQKEIQDFIDSKLQKFDENKSSTELYQKLVSILDQVLQKLYQEYDYFVLNDDQDKLVSRGTKKQQSQILNNSNNQKFLPYPAPGNFTWSPTGHLAVIQNPKFNLMKMAEKYPERKKIFSLKNIAFFYDTLLQYAKQEEQNHSLHKDYFLLNDDQEDDNFHLEIDQEALTFDDQDDCSQNIQKIDFLNFKLIDQKKRTTLHKQSDNYQPFDIDNLNKNDDYEIYDISQDRVLMHEFQNLLQNCKPGIKKNQDNEYMNKILIYDLSAKTNAKERMAIKILEKHQIINLDIFKNNSIFIKIMNKIVQKVKSDDSDRLDLLLLDEKNDQKWDSKFQLQINFVQTFLSQKLKKYATNHNHSNKSFKQFFMVFLIQIYCNFIKFRSILASFFEFLNKLNYKLNVDHDSQILKIEQSCMKSKTFFDNQFLLIDQILQTIKNNQIDINSQQQNIVKKKTFILCKTEYQNKEKSYLVKNSVDTVKLKDLPIETEKLVIEVMKGPYSDKLKKNKKYSFQENIEEQEQKTLFGLKLEKGKVKSFQYATDSKVFNYLNESNIKTPQNEMGELQIQLFKIFYVMQDVKLLSDTQMKQIIDDISRISQNLRLTGFYHQSLIIDKIGSFNGLIYKWIDDLNNLINKYNSYVNHKNDNTDDTCPRQNKGPKLQSSIQCFVCQEIVRSIFLFCGKCQHGGHNDHVQEYFKTNQYCPVCFECKCFNHSDQN